MTDSAESLFSWTSNVVGGEAGEGQRQAAATEVIIQEVVRGGMKRHNSQPEDGAWEWARCWWARASWRGDVWAGDCRSKPELCRHRGESLLQSLPEQWRGICQFIQTEWTRKILQWEQTACAVWKVGKNKTHPSDWRKFGLKRDVGAAQEELGHKQGSKHR